MIFRDNNLPHDRISEILSESTDLTILIINGHRFIEDLLEDYVYHIFPNQTEIEIEHLAFQQKLGIVLSHIDLASWYDESDGDDVDYRIAEEMLGNIVLLGRLRREISLNIMSFIQQATLSYLAAYPDIKRQLRHSLGLRHDVAEYGLMERMRGEVLCLHGYFSSFTESTFKNDGN